MKTKNYEHRKFRRTSSKFKRKEIKRKLLNTFSYVLVDEDFVFCNFEEEIKLKFPNSKVRYVEETIYWNTAEENTGEDEKIILDNDLQLKLMNMGYIVVEPNIGPLSLIRVKCPKAPASIGGSASFVTAGFPMR